VACGADVEVEARSMFRPSLCARGMVVGSMMLLPALAVAGEAGTAGFLSLRLGAGARAAGMGDAQVSLAQDATATYWNPAGLAAVKTTSFTLMHDEWLSTVRMETASLAHATEFGNFGFHFSGEYLDNIERRETASSEPTGTFSAFEYSFAGAYGRRVHQDVDVGLAVKGLYSKLDDVSASGWAVDLGARYRTQVPGLTFAGAAQNLGPKMKFISDEFVLPAVARLGADYQRNVPALRGRLTGAFDFLIPTDGDPRQHFGLEYTYRDIAAARIGYKANYDSQGLTFGVGLRKNGYHFDYAFAAIGNDLGDAHKFAFSVDL
jgi:hypothetical protein